jgi:aerobic-type carbon monoxide dehydrogenase small subunit (CoxS/CutS family)
MPMRPRVEELDLHVRVDGIDHVAHAWSDMTALQVVREVLGLPDVRWRCEAGMCGTCEVILDGAPTRICSVSCRRLDGATVVTPPR